MLPRRQPSQGASFRAEPGRAYLLTTVTANRRPWFREFRLGRLVVEELRAACDAQRAEWLAWVLMPDHLHWLLVLGDATLADLMRQVKSNSARRIRREADASSPVWQRSYHDHAVRRGEDLRRVARYLVANPLRAGLVDDLGRYPLWDAVWV